MVAPRNKLVMCQACRGLIDSSVKTCPLCGREAVPARRNPVSARVGDDNFFSLLILGINIALFLLMAVVDMRNAGEGASFLTSPSQQVFYDFGGRYIPAIESGQWWRLITPTFLHLGLIHLMFNSLALYQIGPQIEAAYGSQKFIFLYLATGTLSNIGAYSMGIRGAGASGAIFGLIGLMAVYGYRLGGTMGRALMQHMLVWAAFGLALGFGVGADSVSHIVGLIGGAGLGFAVMPSEPATARGALVWNCAAIACTAVVAFSFVMVGLHYGKFQSGNEVVKLNHRITRLEDALNKSMISQMTAGANAEGLANEIRVTVSEIETLASIDTRSDEIRSRLVNLANRRADLLSAAKGNPAPLAETAHEDRAELKRLFGEYRAWTLSILNEYGLEYQSRREE